MNLAALLFEVARRLPNRPAVSDGHHSWNYRELIERARPHRRRVARSRPCAG
jgi:non-ribosomal peptide synthetase component E (peptide arylation enzyme)